MKLTQFLTGAALICCAHSALATTLTFDSHPEQYFVPSVVEGGFTFSTLDSLGTNNDTLWPSDGTIHLMSWTNGGSLSGFTMTNTSNSAFSLQSFDFAGGYVSNKKPVNWLSVTGETFGGDTLTTTFNSGIDFSNYTTYTTLFLENYSNLSSVVFTAEGASNRAVFDNFVVDQAVVVPEAETYAMLVAGLSLIGLVARRRTR